MFMRRRKRERERESERYRDTHVQLEIQYIDDIPPASTGQCCSRKIDRQVHVPPQRNLGQHHPESNSCE
jgi:hypothetical protein